MPTTADNARPGKRSLRPEVGSMRRRPLIWPVVNVLWIARSRPSGPSVIRNRQTSSYEPSAGVVPLPVLTGSLQTMHERPPDAGRETSRSDKPPMIVPRRGTRSKRSEVHRPIQPSCPGCGQEPLEGCGGGDGGTRTPDPLNAIEVLSQLSYIPTFGLL